MAFVEQIGPNSWRVRYWTDAGIHGSLSGFARREDAQAKADEIDVEQRRGSFIDPAAGQLRLEQWASSWLDALDVAAETEAQYRSLAACHILPRWGATALGEFSGMAVHKWARTKRADGYSESTVATIVKILSMMLADAAAEKLIAANPIRPQRRGRRRRQRRREIAWATPEQAARIALQAAALAGNWAGLLVVTGAWTGARWGELTGLRRANLHLDPSAGQGTIVVDPDTGTLHEVNGTFFLGPPKTPESARLITLPPFLVEMLARHLVTHDHEHVFLTPEGCYPRRSNFARRVLRPAADGNHDRPRARVRTDPVVAGLTFHGLGHSHKTWMIADNIPEVAQARRLGHILDDKIQNIYSHVAAEVETRLLACLQQRWTTALGVLATANPTPHPHAPPGQPLTIRSPASTGVAVLPRPIAG